MKPDLESQPLLCDPLTGAYTRTALEAQFEQEIARAKRIGYPLSLLLLDLDHFKSINDAFGHPRGDEVLREFFQRIQKVSRAMDTIFRYGGDEFIFILPNTSGAQALKLARRLLKQLRNSPFEGTPPLSLTFSAGIASYPSDGQTLGVLLHSADQRNYQAKRAGRARIYSEDQNLQAEAIVSEPSRLIERERAMETLNSFMGALPDHKRGVLIVSGAPHAGRSLFLAEAGRTAHMRGYAVLALNGQPALKGRMYGVLVEARTAWEGMPFPSVAVTRFIAELQQMLAKRGYEGLIVTLDNLSYVDRATLDFVSSLFVSTAFPQLALIYASDSSPEPRGLPREAPLVKHAQLNPLTPAGTLIWIRQSLQWEPPSAFVHWLHKQTAGLPGLIHAGLKELVAHDLIYCSSGEWICRPDYFSYPLAEILQNQPPDPVQNLPTSLTDFIGRQEEIRGLRQLIQNHRLITVTGPGGIGKSRLAIQAVAESAFAFRDGACFVPLAPLSSADYLITAMADALHLSLSSPQHPQEQLLNYLQSKELILLLDGFEKLLEGTTLIDEILIRSPNLTILVTSRQHLGLETEISFELGGLAIPDPSSTDPLEDYPIIQLFLASARRSSPTFSLGDNDRPFLARICQLVDGMPLGVEFAAAWVHTFTCQEITRKIETNLSFLASDRPEIPERQRSLLAVFDSFWVLLSKEEQNVLRRLSIFRFGFSEAAAWQIAGASPFFLDALTARAYLRRIGHGRYEMHEFLRQYAADKLKEYPAQETKARDRHCTYYAHFLKSRDKRLLSEKKALEEIGGELENIRSAWHWAIEHKRLADLSASLEGLSSAYDLSGFLDEGRRMFELAAERLEKVDHPESLPNLSILRLQSRLRASQAHFLSALGMLDQGIEAAKQAVTLAQASQDTSTQAVALANLGKALRARGAYEAARAPLEDALKLAQPNRQSSVITDILVELGDIFLTQGDHAESIHQYQSAVRIAKKAGNRRGEGYSLRNLGVLTKNQGEYASARVYFERALQIFDETGDRRNSGWAYTNLGLVNEDLGDFSSARACFERALPIYRQTGDRSGECWGLNTLGYDLYIRGEYTAAWNCHQQALQISLTTGDRWAESISISNLGNIYTASGDYLRSREYKEKALAICRQIGDRWGEIWRLSEIGQIMHCLGRDAEARNLNESVLLMTEDTGDRPIQGFAYTRLGRALLGLNLLDDAIHAFTTAAMIRQDYGGPNMRIESLSGVARALLMQTHLDQAVAYVDGILQHMKKGPLFGTEEPLDIPLTCYLVLEAVDDKRASKVVSEACELVKTRAAQISDDEMRWSYLHNVPAHRKILEICKS
ncbi:MAG: tetratricopeptide repeat protein [Anaerolineales bacterium]|nr:tetratricopeptide repeat protein [Anaerolineales bacterium]